jgi:hypothetical protein
MNAVPKSKRPKVNYNRPEHTRRRQEEALDDALKNTFPASDPVSIVAAPDFEFMPRSSGNWPGSGQ